MKTNIKTIMPLLQTVIEAQLVPMIQGSPGIGKSAIGKMIAETYNLKMIDIRLSQCDPTDLNGFPMVNQETKRGNYMPMNTFPLVGDTPPINDKTGEPYEGWLLFLDEFNSAPLMVQAAAYKLVLDREVGEHALHPSVAIMAAGNLETDGAIVNRMSTAMQSRLVHFELESHLDTWMEWAYSADIDYRITAFLGYRSEMLNKFDPDHQDKTFPCERTWEFMAKLLKADSDISFKKMPLYAGTIGKGPAQEFITFAEIFERLPTISEILKNPKTAKAPNAPDIRYATAGMIGNAMNPDNAEQLFIYVERLPIEFQVITMRQVAARDKSMMGVPVFASWLMAKGTELFS